MPLLPTHAHRSGPIASSGIQLVPEIPICQTDLPLDWYQAEFKSYAEEYLALPDRKPATVLPWLDQYALPALSGFDVKETGQKTASNTPNTAAIVNDGNRRE
jgi:hypothetical protein